MKRFILGFLISSALMFGVVYITVLLPAATSVNLLDSSDPGGKPEENESKTTQLPPSETYLERIDKGNTLMKSGYFLLAAVEYQFATQLDPSRETAWFHLGEAQFNGGKYTLAQEALKQATTLNPSNEKAQLLLGTTYLNLELFKTARDHYESLPFANTEALYYRGILAALNNDEPNARASLEQVISRGDNPDYSKNAQRFLDTFDEGALAEDAPKAYSKTLLGRSFAESGEPRLAIPLIYEVLRDEPDYRDAWIILGYSYLTLEKYKESQDALFKAVQLDPTKAESRYFLGLSYFGLDDYVSSVTQLELAIQSGFEPKIQAYQKLGDAAVLATQYAKAAEAYEKVLVLNSDDIEQFIRPVWLNIEHLNKATRARELGEQAVKKHPSDAMSYNLLAWAQLKLNQLKESEKNLNYALILNPDLPAAHYNLGQIYEIQGNTEGAKTEYKSTYTLDPGGSVGNLAAERYNKLIVAPNPSS